jgi:hypothetical protein
LSRIARGQHQHGRLLARFVAQLAADLEAIETRQVEIEHDRVEFVHHRQVQPGDAVCGEVHGVPAFLEKVAEVGGDVLVIFDDEDAHWDRPFLQVRLRPCGRCRVPEARGARPKRQGVKLTNLPATIS